jgi:hypothetical protein
VTTEYLLNPLTGQTAQDSTSNAGNMAGASLLISRSDNTLLDQFLDPILGCTPFQAPDLADNDQYREELGQPPITGRGNKTSGPEAYCQNLVDIQTPFLAAPGGRPVTRSQPVPVREVAHVPGQVYDTAIGTTGRQDALTMDVGTVAILDATVTVGRTNRSASWSEARGAAWTSSATRSRSTPRSRSPRR